MQNKYQWLNELSAVEKTLYFHCDIGFSIMVFNNNKKKILNIPLVQLENLLPSGHFYRVHRRYLVNMNAISELRYFRNQLIAIVDCYRIPVSRRKGKILLDNLNIL